ncbi:hypothetical protein Tco_1551906 [Tanacetum coccineum]
MANKEQNPPQQEQTFVAAKQVGFNLEDIILNTNNEEYLTEFWYSAKALENYKVYISTTTGGIYGEVGLNTFRNAIGAHYLPHSSEYFAPPSIDIEGYGDGELTIYPTQVFCVNNWALKPNQPKEPPFIYHMLAICAADMPVVFKAPKPSSNAERVPQGTKPRAKLGHKKHSTSSKQSSVSSKEATKGGSSKALTSSKTCHSKKRKESTSAMDSNPTNFKFLPLWILECIKRTSNQLVAQPLRSHQ